MPTSNQSSESPQAAGTTIGTGGDSSDPFGLDITFIEDTPATETVLMCSTGDNCGSSCPSACTTS
ncbi:FxLD family lantipeptide [Streptomyces hoynatensis]|uniref:FxLD family lantipeptide n=2 Tax=Streptomyces hoynatensis TaxID=1141874 RepID=A0A3A9ZFI5_9ACTN|nr:FxLD family lantipeptide [Streptomyces hoynatensis]